jgi:phosphoribosylformylglycinamidine synthase
MVRVCVLRGLGINADEELVAAFALAGSGPQAIHVNDLLDRPNLLDDAGILAIPGGFSYGDHLGSGHVLAALFRRRLRGVLTRFHGTGGLTLGICNGFQVLTKAGLLPNTGGSGSPQASLIHNNSGRFEDRWVRVDFDPDSPCVWTRGLRTMDLPVRHGEGRFVVPDHAVMEDILSRRLAPLWYARRDGAKGDVPYPDNPNGSQANIAGICDPTGRVFGLMPHPEAFLYAEHHPRWRNGGYTGESGMAIIRAGVKHAEENPRIRAG